MAARPADEARRPKVRLFAAVELPVDVTAALLTAVAPLRPRFRSLRWTDPDGWHLTLAFLGWVDVDLVDDVEGALTAAARRVEPFPLALTGTAGSFRSGALWAAVAEQPALAWLSQSVIQELTRVMTVPDAERLFRPHLTLARTRGRGTDARDAAAAYRGPDRSWTVERIVLMRSHLLRQGARYEVVGAWPLGLGAHS